MLVVLSLSLLAACLVAGWFGWQALTRPERATDGPLVVPPEHGYLFFMEEGERFTDSLEVLVVKDESTVVLESVELVGAEGMRLLGFKVVPPGRDVTKDFFRGYPPPGVLKALGAQRIVDGPGAVLAPPHEKSGWELLVGIEITKPGPLWREGLRINYSVNGKRYTAVFPAEIQVCTAPGQKGPAGRCRRQRATARARGRRGRRRGSSHRW